MSPAEREESGNSDGDTWSLAANSRQKSDVTTDPLADHRLEDSAWRPRESLWSSTLSLTFGSVLLAV